MCRMMPAAPLLRMGLSRENPEFWELAWFSARSGGWVSWSSWWEMSWALCGGWVSLLCPPLSSACARAHSLSNWKSRAQDHCIVAGHGGATMAQRAEVFTEGFPVEFLVLMGSVESSELHIQWIFHYPLIMDNGGG